MESNKLSDDLTKISTIHVTVYCVTTNYHTCHTNSKLISISAGVCLLCFSKFVSRLS